jgi:hypothetical protein
MSQVFTTHTYQIPMAKQGGKYTIIPFGDVHYDSHNCDRKKFSEFLRRAKTEKNTFYLGMGDYFDFASYTERRSLKNARLHESTEAKLDKNADADVKELCEEIAFMKNRVIGLLEGNHGWEYGDGTTDTDKLSDNLLCKNLGALSYIEIQFRTEDGNTRCTLKLFASHGKGGGKLVGTSFNKVDDMRNICDEADIYLMGHDHKKGILPIDIIGFRRTRSGIDMCNKRKLLVRTGSFLKGYVEDEESYVMRSLMRPSSLGIVKIEVDIKRTREGGSERYDIELNGWS